MRSCLSNRWFRRTAGGLLLLAMVWTGMSWWLGRMIKQAERQMANREWPFARETLQSYLRFYPNDAIARLMLAESYVRDNKFVGDDKISAALEQLSRIPDRSPKAAEARLQEGRLHLLLQLQPGRAEKAFVRSIELDPNRAESRVLLWRLLDLTSRWDSAEPHFWKLYEDASMIERAHRLRDWYLSEFSPGTANAELERRLGLLGESELPSADSDRRRLETFVTTESDWIEGHAILARWYHRQGGLQQASGELDLAEQLPGGSASPLVIATRVAVCLELGDFDRAQQAFPQWPAPHEGYEYWKTAGLIADQVLHNNEQAAQAFEKAIETTAGKSDWLIQHRLAQCLIRLGHRERAAEVRKHSKDVELLMEAPVHTALRRALMTPLAPETNTQMIDLYQRLGRVREVEAWKQLTIPLEQANLSTAENTTSIEDNLESSSRSKLDPDPRESSAK